MHLAGPSLELILIPHVNKNNSAHQNRSLKRRLLHNKTRSRKIRLAVLQCPRVDVGRRSLHQYKLLSKVVTPTRPSSRSTRQRSDHSTENPKWNFISCNWGQKAQRSYKYFHLQKTIKWSLGALTPAWVAELDPVSS